MAGRTSPGISTAAGLQLVAGRAEQLPFPDEAFDALTFTYLLRYVADTAATLAELARVLKPGRSDRQPRVLRAAQPLLAGVVVVVHAGRAAGSGRPGRTLVVQGGSVPWPEHLPALPAPSVVGDGCDVARGRPRRDRRPAHESRRRDRDVGTQAWLSARAGPRSTRPRPEDGATGGRSSTLPTPPGISLTWSSVRASRPTPTLSASWVRCWRSSVPWASQRTRSTRSTAIPCAPRIPDAALWLAAGAGLMGAVVLGLIGLTRVGPGLAALHRRRPGPGRGLQPRALRGPSPHRCRFRARLGHVPCPHGILRAGRANRPRRAARRGGCVRTLVRAALPEHTGASCASPGDASRGQHS